MFEADIREIQDELMDIYRDLHRHPEPGYFEKRSSELIAEYLRSCGLEVMTGVAITGVVGVLDSGRPGKTLMLRADMDCLRVQELTGCDFASQEPGLMHACGHDTHMTMLLGAAKILSMHREVFDGRIKFVLQPPEEGIIPEAEEMVRAAGYNGNGGAGFMIQQGVLDDVDAVLIMHNQPSIPVGSVQIAKRDACASSDVFDISIVGKGGHGARPQEAIDPVPAVGELIGAIHLIPSREVSCLQDCVMSIGTLDTPGSVWNAVAEKACLTGGYRTFSDEVRSHITARIPEIAEGIARAHRCTAATVITPGYSPCINDTDMAQQLSDICSDLLGAEHVELTDIPAMTSEDAGEYLSRVPGVFYWLGSGDPEHALHNPNFLPDPDTIPTGVRVHVHTAVNMLKLMNNI